VPPNVDLSRSILRAGAALVLMGAQLGCSDLLTAAPDAGDVFDAPLEGLTPEERSTFLRGDREFARPFMVADGLGPIFNDVSCAACHSGDGRGHVRNTLMRIGVPADGMLASLGGPQIQTRAIPGAVAEELPAGVAVSHRLPPPVFGMGLIEAIPESAILAHADPTDADGDGVSGRPNLVFARPYVPHDAPGGGAELRLGRFGRKAQVSSLIEQVTEAYHQDMGITSEFIPAENVNPRAAAASMAADGVADPEVTTATVISVVNYVRFLAPPSAGVATDSRQQGEQTFRAIGCAACHVPSLRTGVHAVAALSGRDVAAYSDFLLHDMGDALADHRTDAGATGREWRTTPLWGLRLVRAFLDGQGYFLHDGRARTVDEAIRLHGGEASRSRDRYAGLTEAQRAALLDFVGSR
jgi:CxxC motif-containing protein (DUF1111 family)